MEGGPTFPKKWLAGAAILVALVGVVDAGYLTWHHFTAEPVPCDLTNGCEMVLTSPYATLLGVPLALFGLLAYLAALVLAVLAFKGTRWAWPVFGLQAFTMTAFSGWLIYVQAYYINAFCQFCLLSAATSTTLFLLFLLSIFFRGGNARG